MNAVERGSEMMTIPIGQLPPLAVEFAKSLCKEFGGCGEVLMTAWCVYAQCVEGLPCDDDLYLSRPVDVQWFKERIEGDVQPNHQIKVQPCSN